MGFVLSPASHPSGLQDVCVSNEVPGEEDAAEMREHTLINIV